MTSNIELPSGVPPPPPVQVEPEVVELTNLTVVEELVNDVPPLLTLDATLVLVITVPILAYLVVSGLGAALEQYRLERKLVALFAIAEVAAAISASKALREHAESGSSVLHTHVEVLRTLEALVAQAAKLKELLVAQAATLEAHEGLTAAIELCGDYMHALDYTAGSAQAEIMRVDGTRAALVDIDEQRKMQLLLRRLIGSKDSALLQSRERPWNRRFVRLVRSCSRALYCTRYGIVPPTLCATAGSCCSVLLTTQSTRWRCLPGHCRHAAGSAALYQPCALCMRYLTRHTD
jgi:hypothetical protein